VTTATHIRQTRHSKLFDPSRDRLTLYSGLHFPLFPWFLAPTRTRSPSSVSCGSTGTWLEVYVTAFTVQQPAKSTVTATRRKPPKRPGALDGLFLFCFLCFSLFSFPLFQNKCKLRRRRCASATVLADFGCSKSPPGAASKTRDLSNYPWAIQGFISRTSPWVQVPRKERLLRLQKGERRTTTRRILA
jgi:hypothetical protein